MFVNYISASLIIFIRTNKKSPCFLGFFPIILLIPVQKHIHFLIGDEMFCKYQHFTLLVIYFLKNHQKQAVRAVEFLLLNALSFCGHFHLHPHPVEMLIDITFQEPLNLFLLV